MIYRSEFRHWLSTNITPLFFLTFYFATVVLGNLIYLTSFGKGQLTAVTFYSQILAFETFFSFGFCILLFLPFIVTPLIVFYARRVSKPFIHKLCGYVPEIPSIDYILLTSLCYLFVIYSMVKGDVFSLSVQGEDSVSSVESRFKILSQLGFICQVILMSILPYLSIYSLIRYLQKNNFLWGAIAIFNVILITGLLVVLNMKWPVLIYGISVSFTFLIYANKKPYIKFTIGLIVLSLVYCLITAYVYRMLPLSQKEHQPSLRTRSVSQEYKLPSNSSINKILAIRVNLLPVLVWPAINRMAISYPFYYQTFTTKGFVCGGVLEQMHKGPKCRPSTYIYQKIFGKDGFEGRGTSPAAIHISAYALHGWPTAIIALVFASLLCVFFTCLPLDLNATISSFVVTGGITGYHLSQLPVEGPLIYNHGILWIVLILVSWHLLSRQIRFFLSKYTLKRTAII